MAAKAKKKRPAKARRPASRTTKKAPKKTPKKAPRPAAAAVNPWPAWAASYANESAITAKVMRAFPLDQPTFSPHERSSNATKLMWTFVIEQRFTAAAIKGTLTMPPNFGTPPATLGEILPLFDAAVAEALAAARAAKAAHWSRPAPFFGRTGPIELPTGLLAGIMLNDQIHHRGQLSVYIRLAGGKVPSIYGPSADEPW